MSCLELFVTIDSKEYRLGLEVLTMGALKKQILNVLKVDDEQENVLIKITDANACDIETDEQLQQAIKNSKFDFIAYVQQQRTNEEKRNTPETLDFKRHWDMGWIISNTEAVKIVEQMLSRNEKGLIAVIANEIEQQNSAKKKSNGMTSSFISCINNDAITKKQEYGDYWLYVMKQNLIIFDEMIIDGNVYAVECEIECKGNVTITTQLF
ncbi:hypothetical protein RFI_05888, partial [Reticulomyxa filosa]